MIQDPEPGPNGLDVGGGRKDNPFLSHLKRLSLYKLKLHLSFVAPKHNNHKQTKKNSFCSIPNLLLRVQICIGRLGISAKDTLGIKTEHKA